MYVMFNKSETKSNDGRTATEMLTIYSTKPRSKIQY